MHRSRKPRARVPRRASRGRLVGLKPTLVVVAGPNGAGKTTLAAEEFILGEVVVNADEIARSLPSASPVEAGRIAIRERRRCFTSRTSFAIETTISGRRELELMRGARETGFMVALHYIGVESPELCRIRIDERVKKGGHDVSDADLVRRYHRSVSNLSSAIALAHIAFVYDNSTRHGIKPIARFSSGVLHECAPEVPRWMERALGSLLRR